MSGRLARVLPLPLIVGALATPVPEQLGGKPAIADLISPPNGTAINNPTSPLFNVPNGYWDKGEAYLNPEVPDVGGVLAADLRPQDALRFQGGQFTYLKDLRTPGGWQTISTPVSSNLQNWVGEIRGLPIGEPGTANVASFEILAPANPNPASTTQKPYAVVVISNPPTFVQSMSTKGVAVMLPIRVIGLLLAVLVAAAAPAQRTWIVDANNGPGTNFTDLPPAVAAAQANDIILVRTGDYSPTTITKGIRVVGAWGGVYMVPLLTVRDLPAGEYCAIKGLFGPGTGASRIIIENNVGSIHMELYRVFAGTDTTLDIRNCAQVTLTRCNSGRTDIDSSNVVVSECGFGPTLLNSSYAISVTNSKLTVAHSSVYGSDGWIDPFCTVAIQPGPGIVATNSDILLAGAGVGVSGGTTNVPQWPCQPTSVKAPGIVGTGGTLTYDSTLGRPVFNSVTGTIRLIQRSVPCLNVASDWPGGILDLRLFGPANAAEVVLASLPRRGAPLYPDPTPGWPGLWIDENAFYVVQAGTIPSTRTLQVQMPHFVPPALYHLPIAFQAVVALQGGVPELSTGGAAILN